MAWEPNISNTVAFNSMAPTCELPDQVSDGIIEKDNMASRTGRPRCAKQLFSNDQFAYESPAQGASDFDLVLPATWRAIAANHRLVTR